jgi:hypothetical protein
VRPVAGARPQRHITSPNTRMMTFS